jgi:hypothetical protein
MTLDKGEREAAATHVGYEIKMLAAAYAWTVRFDHEGPAVLRNACLESTMVHARLLIEFLAGRPRRGARYWSSQDISPRDFVTGWSPGNRLDGYLEIADKHVVHLSRDRAVRETPQTYALTRIVDSILSEFGAFTDAAERSKSPFVELFRLALSNALYLRDHAPNDWPPELDSRTP